MSSIYTEKYVLFLDILGFEAYVNDEKKSEEFARKVLSLFDKILQKKQDPNQYLLFDDIDFNEVAQFSDTFVISSEYIEVIVDKVISIQTALLMKNLLSRGAITYGKVFHKSSQFIGPAINRAYNLEKSKALYPRVIIDPLCEEKIVKMIQGEYKKDGDGYLYIEFLTRLTNFKRIEKLYEKYKDTHSEKYTWLKQKADEVKEVRRKQEDLKKYKHKETYDMLPFQDEFFNTK